MMMGILKPTSGHVILGGYDVEQEAQRAKALAGFIPDRPFIYEKLSGCEFLEFVGKLHRMEPEKLRGRIAELLGSLELTRWRDELVESYSHGMKQRLVVCAALIHEPRILIIDEPMVGMDPKGARTLKNLFRSLAEKGTTVFLSTHSIGVAEEVCDRIGIIHKGRLIEELDMDELERRRARRLAVDARDRAAARTALEAAGYAVHRVDEDGSFVLNESCALEAPDQVARVLVAAGTPPIRLAVEQDDLEQHFLRLSGGSR